ncbi:unnamed protein product [Ilex paraguariensis]|uniref:Uncharacterized protein n=1 Tax=Ilex paraguariensis TaxID=185542 RepID=A0ABC8T2N3_9AQUA
MSLFHHEEPPNPSKKCKFLKDAFTNCHTFSGRLSSSATEEDDPASDCDDEQELFVSAVISKYKEAKCRRKASFTVDSISWALSPTRGEFCIPPKAKQQKENTEKETEDFFSVKSCLSRCSSTSSMDAYVSVRTTFSRCSSLNRIDFPDFRRRSIIREFSHCEGWPFGLCRKALLLPPLPKSPSESWSWRKKARMV